MEFKAIFVICFLACANAAVVPPLNGCGKPQCSNTTLLFPNLNVGLYWQCVPVAGCDDWEAVERPCPKGMWFSYKEQVCVRCSDKEWFDNPCNLNELPECICEDPPSEIEQPEVPEVPPNNCEVPNCHDVEILYPHKEANKYWQCAPVPGCDEWAPVEKICPFPLVFGYKQQVCVWECDWTNICSGPPVTTTSTAAPTTTTTRTTTTTTRPTTTTTTPTTTTTTPTTTTTSTTTTDSPSSIVDDECPPINCKNNATMLYADPTFPTKFWQCVPTPGCEGEWNVVAKDCPNKDVQLYFNFKLQVCDWCISPCINFNYNDVYVPQRC